MMDKIGIDLSIAFGTGSPEKNRKVFSQGCLSLIISCCAFSLPALLSIEWLLLKLGIDDRVADLVQSAIYPFLSVFVTQMFSESVRTFCLAQGLESTLGNISIVNNIISMFTNWYFIVWMDLGLKGWVYCDLIFETINLLAGLWVMREAQDGTVGFASIKDILDGFGSYFCESIKFMLGTYCEYIGFELTSIYIARLGNNDHIGAYSCIVSFATAIYRVGLTFSIACRTRINILIGAKHHKVAKNFFKFFLAAAFLFGVVLGIVVYLCRYQITKIYADSTEEMSNTFTSLLLVYSISIPSETTLYSSYVGMKTTGNMTLLLILNVIIVIGLNGSIGWYLGAHGYPPAYLFLFLMSLLWVVNFISAVYSIVFADWSKITPEEEERQALL